MTKAIKTTLPEGKKLIKTGCKVHFFRSIRNISSIWEMAQPADNIFLQRPYLTLLEDNPPEGMQFCYMVFTKEQTPVGVAACQIQYFNADKSLQAEGEKKDSPCFFETFGRYVKGIVANRVDFYTLVCGNLLLTGEHGFYFNPNYIKPTECFEILDEAMIYAMDELSTDKFKISAVLVKEFYEETLPHAKELVKQSFKEFTIEPSMIMDIPSEWESFDDYLAAMFSKYRVRVKRAFKKGKDLERKELNEAEIAENLPLLYSLYNNVAENSGFNLVNLNEKYLLALKQTLGDQFQLVGYYLDGQMVAYHTNIWNGHELEAHFLGFDKQYNHSHQVYLNILYDLVRKGIEGKAEKIVFARTALEIKSSVGAVAHDMYCYFRHRSSFTNRFLNPLLDYLKPNDEWQPRHPFKPLNAE